MMAGENDLTFRARLIDEISAPARKIKQSLGEAGRAAKAEFGKGFAEGSAQARAELGKAASATEKQGGSLRRLGSSARTAAGGTREVTTETKKFGWEAGQAKAKSFSLSDTMSRLGTFAKVGAAGLGAAVIGLAKLGKDTAANSEQMQVSFTTLMKSASRAKDETAWLTKQAAATPFELADLTKADRTLLGFGMTTDKVRRDFLLAMGDIGSAVGVTGAEFPEFAKVFGQIHAVGKLTTENMMQLVDRGVSLDSVAKKMGMTVPDFQKAMTAGKISAAEFEDAIRSMAKTDYAGGMEAQSKTFNGVMSSFKDSVALAMGQMMEPLLPILKDILTKASEAFTWLGKQVPVWVAAAKKAIADFSTSPAWAAIKSTATAIKDAIQATFKWIIDNKDFVISAVVGIGAAFAIFQTIQAVLRAVAAAQMLWNAALAMNPIMLVVGSIAALIAALVWFFTQTETGRAAWSAFTSFLSSAWETTKSSIGAGVEAVKGFFSGLWNNLLAGVNNVKAWFASLPSALGGFMAGATAAIGSQVDNILGFFRDLPGKIMGFIGGLKDRVASVFQNMIPDWVPGIGDTALPHGSGRGNLANTMGAYLGISHSIGSRPGISNMMVGGGGRGRGSGDHQSGRALDLVGSASTLLAFRKAALARGAFAEFHGSGKSRHLHFVPPAGGPRFTGSVGLTPGGMGDTTSSVASRSLYGGIVVEQVTIYAQDGTDAAERFLERLKRIRQDELERA